MKRTKILSLIVLGILFLWSGKAQTAQSSFFVITNDNVSTPLNMNTASVFRLNTSTGALTQVKVLQTGGIGTGFGYDGEAMQSVSQDASCVFVADPGSSDIAAFSKATVFAKVGNYSDLQLDSGLGADAGFSFLFLAENPAGTVLYGAYGDPITGSQNLGVWAINSDCSLTLANVYPTPSGSGGIQNMTVTSDDTALLATYGSRFAHYWVQYWAISGTTLTSNDPVQVVGAGAGILNITATNDDKVAVMSGDQASPGAIVTASLPGFTNQQLWSNPALSNGGMTVLSANAAAGSGCVYLLDSDDGILSGATFTESPVNVSFTNTANGPDSTEMDTIATISNSGNGAGIYGSTYNYNNEAGVQVYSANSSCQVTYVKFTEAPIANQYGFLLSLSSWSPR